VTDFYFVVSPHTFIIPTINYCCVILEVMFFSFSICDLLIGNEGLGFHIKGHSPVVIYAIDPGLPAARAGVVPGSCVLEVWLDV